ncbi:MAG: enoyl-ACP reductase [Victivallales bacterium]
MSAAIDLRGKKAVVLGVANEKSIAWAIAKVLNDNGCRVSIGHQERNTETVLPLLKELNNPFARVCDFTSDQSIQDFFGGIEGVFGNIDIIIHSAAFAKKEFLRDKFSNITRSGFDTAMEVSAYSFSATVKYAEKLLNDESSVLTLTYAGANRAVPNYNIMGACKAALESSVRYLAVDLGGRGIRVNAISAGPIATSAAAGIGGFEKILESSRNRNPLKRNISPTDVANCALFLCSGLARNITGQVIYVDAGDSAT